MIKHTRISLLGLTFMVSLISSGAAADDSLLWKTVNTNAPSVVPAYTGQEGPFPKVIVVSATVAQDEIEAERQRQRDNAFNYAEGLIRAGKGLQPEMRTLRVGGMLDGNLGQRILLNNQWVGVGAKVPVRLTKTAEVQEALKLLATFDESAANELGGKIDAELTSNPLLNLTVQRITSSSLALGSPGGKSYSVEFNMNSN